MLKYPEAVKGDCLVRWAAQRPEEKMKPQGATGIAQKADEESRRASVAVEKAKRAAERQEVPLGGSPAVVKPALEGLEQASPAHAEHAVHLGAAIQFETAQSHFQLFQLGGTDHIVHARRVALQNPAHELATSGSAPGCFGEAVPSNPECLSLIGNLLTADDPLDHPHEHLMAPPPQHDLKASQSDS